MNGLAVYDNCSIYATCKSGDIFGHNRFLVVAGDDTPVRIEMLLKGCFKLTLVLEFSLFTKGETQELLVVFKFG